MLITLPNLKVLVFLTSAKHLSVFKISSAASQLHVGPQNHFGSFHQSSDSCKHDTVTPLDPKSAEFSTPGQ